MQMLAAQYLATLSSLRKGTWKFRLVAAPPFREERKEVLGVQAKTYEGKRVGRFTLAGSTLASSVRIRDSATPRSIEALTCRRAFSVNPRGSQKGGAKKWEGGGGGWGGSRVQQQQQQQQQQQPQQQQQQQQHFISFHFGRMCGSCPTPWRASRGRMT